MDNTDTDEKNVYSLSELDKAMPKWKKTCLALLLIGCVVGALGIAFR